MTENTLIVLLLAMAGIFFGMALLLVLALDRARAMEGLSRRRYRPATDDEVERYSNGDRRDPLRAVAVVAGGVLLVPEGI